MKTFSKVVAVLALAAAFIAVPLRNAAGSEDEGGYSFSVKNTTKVKITKLLASEDGKTYGNFDIGGGIAPGKSMTLQWDKSTDGSGCEWHFKAVFADGDESESKKFDFCEDDLELEF